MTNILYIADPNSIHDIKWITWFSSKDEYNCYVIKRESMVIITPNNINLIGSLSDYSIFQPWKI